jgi:DMSO/TMAO reductase YedYZ molybdopterin-dependent catalytic subunit
MDDIKALPKHEITYDFKCVEGWNMITNWSGALFSDFVKRYKLATRSGNEYDTDNPNDIANYAGLETPDGGYYVGLDIESALHPQTILCYEMNGQPLTTGHGAPLRLITPTKYGIKNIKRIGKITFADERPRDYWFERGYDYFAGL